MKNYKRKKSKSYFRYLTSYLIIFLIPVLILSAFLGSEFIGDFRKDGIETNLSVVKKIKATMDESINEINRIAIAIVSNQHLVPVVMDKSDFSQYEAVLELRNYVESNSVIDDVVLYVRNSDVLYTQDKVYNFDDFYKYKYCDASWSLEQFKENVNSIATNDFRIMKAAAKSLTGKNDEYIAYYQPCPQFGAYATLVFILNITKYQEAIADIVSNESAAEFIMSGDGSILIPCGDVSIADYFLSNKLELIQNINQNKDHKYFIQRVNGSKYIFSYISSEVTDWTYVTVVPYSDVMTNYHQVLKITFMMLIIVVFFGVLCIAYMMKKIYKPLYMLRKNIDYLLDAPVATDDLDVIQNVIVNIEGSNKEIKNKIEAYQSFLSDSAIYSVINGISIDDSKMCDVLTEMNITLNLKCFAVSVIECSENMASIKDTIDDNDSVLGKNIKVYSTWLSEENKNRLALLFNFSNNDDYSLICKYILMLISGKSKGYNIGFGNPYEGDENITRSYVESRSALEYSLFKGNSNMVLINDISSLEQLYYPVNEVSELISYLKQGDVEQIKSTLNYIFDNVKKSTMPSYIIKCCSFDIINSYLRVMLDLNIDIELLHENEIDIFSLINFKDIEYLKCQLEKASEVICAYIKDSLKGGNYALKDEIVEYIQQNFRDPNFSVKIMSNHFDMNVPYLSRFFKKHMNETITEYVTNLRMNEVKFNMEMTDKSIHEIVLEVGYIDVPSFCRKFKQYEGMSPSEYRKIVRKKTI